nr:hypothetical protein Iba_chr11aCG16270 [Ipomoea batatas]
MKKKQSLQRIELPNEMKGFNYLQKKWSARRKVHGSRRHSNEACHQDDGGSGLPCASARLGDDCRYSRRWQAVADGSGGAVVGCDSHEVGVGDIMVGDGVLAASVSFALLNRFSRSSKMVSFDSGGGKLRWWREVASIGGGAGRWLSVSLSPSPRFSLSTIVVGCCCGC